MAKTYVAMGHEQCPVCGEKHNESVILDRSLNNSFEDGVSLRTGFSLCPEHQQQRDDGYVFIIAVKGDNNTLQGKAIILHEDSLIELFGEQKIDTDGILFMDLDDFEELFEHEVTLH